jgi:hypothetical protein
MRRTVRYTLALLCALGATLVYSQERKMDVAQAPETVFAEPVAKLLPELAGATATGENGRVGAELVFWGYRLGDGRKAFLFACAQRADVNCEERVPMICVDHTSVLRTGTAVGNVVHRECHTIAVVQPGETRPGCIDKAETAPLTIGLVSCG